MGQVVSSLQGSPWERPDQCLAERDLKRIGQGRLCRNAQATASTSKKGVFPVFQSVFVHETTQPGRESTPEMWEPLANSTTRAYRTMAQPHNHKCIYDIPDLDITGLGPKSPSYNMAVGCCLSMPCTPGCAHAITDQSSPTVGMCTITFFCVGWC